MEQSESASEFLTSERTLKGFSLAVAVALALALGTVVVVVVVAATVAFIENFFKARRNSKL